MGRPRIPVRDDAFDRATPEAHYWIGFLMADGTVYDRGPARQDQFRVCLLDVDRGHLERFAAFLGYEGTVRTSTSNHGKKTCELFVTSQPLVDALARYGVVPQKTHSARVTGLESDPDFWRGVIDGDGWLSDPNGRMRQLQLVGSRDLMQQFSDYVATLMPYAPPLPLYAHKSIYRVAMSHIRLMTVLPVLYYDGCVALPRKSQRARGILQIPLQRPKRKY